MLNSEKRLKYACYTACLAMSIVANLPPVLLITFRKIYGLSYTVLGLLIFINYATQLGIDLIFSFFSYKFNIPITVKTMPCLTFVGLGLYSVYPILFPETAYIGLIVGTVIFSAAAGLAEVLISPIFSTIPCIDPDREMSRLHSIYAWGVIPVILITTFFIMIFGQENWYYLVFFFMLLPLVSVFLFSGSNIPSMKSERKFGGIINLLKDKTVWIFIFAIFLGGAAECTMSQWSSGYLEKALGIPKIYGDVFGVALFALMLGIGRTLYAKYGKNILKMLIWGSLGAFVCYFAIAVSPHPVVGIIACGLTGFFTSMLWPGTLVVASDKFGDSGVVIYALMAAGGDFGAAIGPQLIGSITDLTISSKFFVKLSHTLEITPEQIGMKLGVVVAMLFPLIAVFVFLKIKTIVGKD